MGSFLIDSYKVRLEIQRAGNPVGTSDNRLLEIVSVPQLNGIRELAVLNFSSLWDNWSGTPVVGFHNVANPLQPVLTGWLPSSEYSLWYDVLRSEKPLTFFYNITPIGGATYVNDISLGTSTEPIGEGPADLSPRPFAHRTAASLTWEPCSPRRPPSMRDSRGRRRTLSCSDAHWRSAASFGARAAGVKSAARRHSARRSRFLTRKERSDDKNYYRDSGIGIGVLLHSCTRETS